MTQHHRSILELVGQRLFEGLGAKAQGLMILYREALKLMRNEEPDHKAKALLHKIRTDKGQVVARALDESSGLYVQLAAGSESEDNPEKMQLMVGRVLAAESSVGTQSSLKLFEF